MNSNIFAVDNLYILDVEGNKNTLKVLEYFDANIQKYNGLTKRKLRIYRITKPMIKEGGILKALEQKNIKSLPTLEIFQPVRQTFSGAPEIIAFTETLFKATMSIRQRQQQQQRQSSSFDDISLLDDTNKLYSDFYKNEIIGKENEEDVGANISTNISDRYRNALERRSGKRDPMDDDGDGPTLQDAPPARRAPSMLGDAMGSAPPQHVSGGGSRGIPMDNVRASAPGPNVDPNTAEDSVMASVRKAAQGAGADADLEISLFQNKFEVTQT